MSDRNPQTSDATAERQQRHRRIFGIAALSALGFHATALLLIHGMTFISQMGSGKDTHNNLLYKDPESATAVLKHTFESIIVSPADVIRRPTPVSGEQPTAPRPNAELTSPLPNLVRELPTERVDTPPAPESLVIDATQDLLTGETNPSEAASESTLAIDFGDSEALTDDLIEATDVIQGHRPQQYAETASPKSSEQMVGQREDARLHNIAAERRSGAIDAGTRAGAANARPSSGPGSAQQRASATPFSDNSAASALVGSVASSNDFSLDVRFTPAPDDGYLFQVRFVPKDGVNFLRIKQNVFFLLDRSHSISKRRYEVSKDAIIKSLQMLQDGDTFNILVFDAKVVKLAEQPLPWSLESIDKAESFLRRQPYGGVFASTDLYSSLDKIVPKVVAETEVNTAILLSDGDTFLERDDQRATISDWSRRNRGKISLFSVASGRGNNGALLDLLSANNKGMFTFCETHEQLPNTLCDLLQKIQNPIGKDLVATVIPPDEDTVITIYPRPRRLADLYEHLPYTMHGHINKLSNFYVFLQGKYYDRWFDIKQLVAFDDARPGNDFQMGRQWAIHQAYDCYDHFLAEGESGHLYRAKRLLDPYKIPVAFP